MAIKQVEEIHNQLTKLKSQQALTFGYLICKKLFPDYATFSEYEEFGKPEVLYNALIVLRKHISGAANAEEIAEFAGKLWDDEDIAPDTDDFAGNLSASLALNTASAIYNLLKFAETSKTDYLLKISELSLESIIMFYVVTNQIDQNLPKQKYDAIINNSVFVQSEIKLQEKLIEQILTHENTSKPIHTLLKTAESRLVENNLFSQLIYT